jgi:hypothetical protein
MVATTVAMRVVLLIPVYNDAAPVQQLLGEVDAEMRGTEFTIKVVIVDDGSLEPPRADTGAPFQAISEIAVVRLRRNVGHQRAIAIGLCYLEANDSFDYVVVMDGDGEDRPTDVAVLLRAAMANDQSRIVFAERARRSEGPLFHALYVLYKALHLILTGIRVRVGNFSVIPRSLLSRLVAVSDLWNHYAAAVFKSRLPFGSVPTVRGKRYAGDSKMNVVALVTHGLSAMAAFGDRIGVRLLAATVTLAVLLVAVVFGGWALHAAGLVEIPWWAPLGLGFGVVVLFQAFAIALAFVFIILAGRESSTFLPLRDYSYYILDVQQIGQPIDGTVPVRR